MEAGKVNMFSGPFVEKMRAGLARGIKVAAIHYQNEVKKTISIKYPPASVPDEPPHLRTGLLRASIQNRRMPDGMTIMVLSDKKYARHLEWGLDPNLKPRPFFRPTLTHNLTAMKALVIQEVGRGVR